MENTILGRNCDLRGDAGRIGYSKKVAFVEHMSDENEEEYI